MERRATALTDSEVLDYLSDSIVHKLTERERSNCLLSSGSLVRIQPGTLSILQGQLLEKNRAFLHGQEPEHDLSCQQEENAVTTLSDALSAYRNVSILKYERFQQ